MNQLSETKKYNIIRFIVISIMGTLLHFTYDWSGENPIVGLFSATNESTWEHLKLLFFPFLFMTIWKYFKYGGISKEFLSARTISLLLGMLFIVTTFYTVYGVTGRLIEWVNISLYYVAVAFTLWMEKKLLDRGFVISPYVSVAILIYITVLFAIFTFKAPDVGIFRDYS